MIKVVLKKGEEKRVLEGHPWVFHNEIENLSGSFDPGDIVDCYSFKHQFIGRGFINPHSKIRIRMLSRTQPNIDESFFAAQIKAALNYRTQMGIAGSFRVVFGEADFLPGLIIDKFDDYLVLQTLSLGIDRWKEAIVDILKEMFHPNGIYERNDAKVRELEGLEQKKGVLWGEIPEDLSVLENEIRFSIDFINGQKTGHFLDQKENHAAIKPYVSEANVLDAFSHTGGFGLHAAYYGAKNVVCVDLSEEALSALNKNAEKKQSDRKCNSCKSQRI